MILSLFIISKNLLSSKLRFIFFSRGSFSYIALTLVMLMQVPWVIRIWWNKKELSTTFGRTQRAPSEKFIGISWRRLKLLKLAKKASLYICKKRVNSVLNLIWSYIGEWAFPNDHETIWNLLIKHALSLLSILILLL